MTFKIFVTVASVALTSVCAPILFAQKLSAEQVPQAVKAAFSKQFPTAKRIKWELEAANQYEVDFRQAKTDCSALFDQNGGLLVTETEIKTTDLPASVIQALKTQFAGFKIEEVEKVVFQDGTIAYELAIEKGEQSLEVQFNSEGKVLKQEAEKKD